MVVLRNYSITPTRAPADIRDASHPAPIWRASRGARPSDGGLVVSQALQARILRCSSSMRMWGSFRWTVALVGGTGGRVSSGHNKARGAGVMR